MISNSERQVVLIGLKTQDAEIKHGFFVAGMLSWIGFGVCMMAIMVWISNFISGQPGPFNPFLWISLPGMAISGVSIWLSKATGRKAARWRTARNKFWDVYGYRPGEW